MKKLMTICAVMMIMITTAGSMANAGLVYSTGFESGTGSEWSNTLTSITPSGRQFLGEFGTNTVTLTLDNLPEHNYILLTFDLFMLKSMDGSCGAWGDGPDIFTLNADNHNLLQSTFSIVNFGGYEQSYPAAYNEGIFSPRTMADENNTLGYGSWGDAVWSFGGAINPGFEFAHSGSTLQVSFSSAQSHDIGNESWGIDNVAVHLIPGPADINEDGFVTVSDLIIMGTQWLSSPQEQEILSADTNKDGIVDLLDLAILAQCF